MGKLKTFVKRVPGVYPLYHSLRRARNAVRSLNSPFLRMFPAGHFYSPLADMKQIVDNRAALFKRDVADCPGVDLNTERQLKVLDELAHFYGELPFPDTESSSGRFYYENPFFRQGDAIVIFGMLRRLRPRRVIEVGSGFSSAAMLDTNDKFLGGDVEFTFIEPYSGRLRRLLTDEDKRRCRIIELPVQDVSLIEFDRLEANDILFIDSSHVVKIGSDVRHLLWEVLPRLKAGVVVHFHDVAWPFEYLEEWVLDGNGWNEAYFLRAFLQYNSAFQIDYFNSYMATVHRGIVEMKAPLILKNPGGGLWLRKAM